MRSAWRSQSTAALESSTWHRSSRRFWCATERQRGSPAGRTPARRTFDRRRRLNRKDAWPGRFRTGRRYRRGRLAGVRAAADQHPTRPPPGPRRRPKRQRGHSVLHLDGVTHPVVVGVDQQRVAADGDLHRVRQRVRIAVGLGRIGSEHLLRMIGEPVGVGFGHRQAGSGQLFEGVGQCVLIDVRVGRQAGVDRLRVWGCRCSPGLLFRRLLPGVRRVVGSWRGLDGPSGRVDERAGGVDLCYTSRLSVSPSWSVSASTGSVPYLR